MKSLISIIFLSLVLNNCGFKPIYNSKNGNFEINIKKFDKDNFFLVYGENDLLENVKKDKKISNFIEKKSVFKHIIVKNKLVNLIVK